MPHFDIIRRTAPKNSFRVASVMGTYDLQERNVEERFIGDIDLPKECPAMIKACSRDPHWRITRVNRVSSGSGLIQNKNIKGSTSCARITAGLEWRGT